jgi:predicted AlkP superfamily pyrophosphatase or phosphodiesterase
MRRYLFLLSLFFTGNVVGQTADANTSPKLVVGIVVDQMREEYLYRFQNKFGEGGFRRLMNDGMMLKNAHYNYVPTVTAPGHASVYTGSTPAIHGIIGNEWYDKNLRKVVYCVTDPAYAVVGSPEGKGDASPMRLLSSTITDELKLATQKRSKVIGISLKDRGSILPAGHLANAAYWFDGKSGRFITSSYYMSKLPEWVEKFNQLNLADKYLNQEWKTFYPIAQYTESWSDDSPYETKIPGKDKPVFPYNLKELRAKNANFDLLTRTPFGNDYLTEMIKAAITGEGLASDDDTDFLAISFSSTDILGHAVGPNAIEIEDMYIRLDKNIEDLLKTLDQKAGAGNYTVFLTADHAVADVAQYMKDSHMPAGYFSAPNTKARLNAYLQSYFPGKELIESIDDDQIYFDHEAFQRDPKSSGVELMVATELVVNFLQAQDGVANAFSESVIRQSQYDEGGIKGMVTRGYHPKRSGDIIIVLEPGWYSATKTQGTTHSSPYKYDTHVPVIFYGKGIRKGTSVRYHSITDIAPTISMLLNIKFPSGCTGQPIEEIFGQE